MRSHYSIPFWESLGDAIGHYFAKYGLLGAQMILMGVFVWATLDTAYWMADNIDPKQSELVMRLFGVLVAYSFLGRK